MKDLKNLFKLPVYFGIIFSLFATQAYAKRWGLAARYTIPDYEDTHLIYGNSSRLSFDPNSIKVWVWNILKGERRHWERDFKKYGRDRDLFVLQEGYMDDKVERVFSDFSGFRWDMGVSFLWKKKNNTPTGTVLGSNVEPLWIKRTQTIDREPFIKTPKALTIGLYPIEGRDSDLLVISVHGINFTSTAAFKRHMAQAEEEIRKHDGHVIFAGDFNTHIYGRKKHLFKVAKKHGLTSVSFKNDKRTRPLGIFLDWTFIRGLNIKKAEVLHKLKSSDHKSMYMELSAK